jgi:ubiquinone/menaquinone biosynthesis C-methylase UbiE
VLAIYKAKLGYRSKKTAETYDQIRFVSPQGRLLDATERSAVLDLLGEFPQTGLVLDLACGSGRFASMLLEAKMYTVCADVSLEMLKISRHRLREYARLVGLVLCDAETMPFKEDVFEGMTMIRLMGVLPEGTRENILREVARVAKRAVLNFPNSKSVNVFIRLIWFVMRKHTEYFPLSIMEFEKDVRSNGLRITNLRGPLLIPPRRFPACMMQAIKTINEFADGCILRLFSEQSFVLLVRDNDYIPLPQTI